MAEGERVSMENGPPTVPGHYKKQAAWKDKADNFGHTVKILLGRWKHMHSWYGKLHLKKAGQAVVKRTDREKYIVAKCGFLSRLC